MSTTLLRMHRRFGIGRQTAGLMLLALASASCQQAAGGAQQATDIERLVARCSEDMVRQTCRVMTTPAASLPSGTTVFVAGVGAIDADVYNQLRANGQAMCESVRQSCFAAWGGAACTTARALYADG